MFILAGINFTFLLFNFFWNWRKMNFIAYSFFIYEYPLVLIIPLVLHYIIHSLIYNKNDEFKKIELTFISEN